MAISYKKTVAVLSGHCAVEEAEGLLSWLLDNPRGRINLRHCEHLHTAVLQVLLACRPALTAPPDSPALAWLPALLTAEGETTEAQALADQAS